MVEVRFHFFEAPVLLLTSRTLPDDDRYAHPERDSRDRDGPDTRGHCGGSPLRRHRPLDQVRPQTGWEKAGKTLDELGC